MFYSKINFSVFAKRKKKSGSFVINENTQDIPIF